MVMGDVVGDIDDAQDCESINDRIKEIEFALMYDKEHEIELSAKLGILEQRKSDLGCS